MRFASSFHRRDVRMFAALIWCGSGCVCDLPFRFGTVCVCDRAVRQSQIRPMRLHRRPISACPMPIRRAIQDALIWTGDYKGIVDGQFGRGTRDSIVAYAKRSHLPTDGTLDAKARSTLLATAAKAKQAAGFAPINDQRSGARLGVPQTLLPKATALKSGTRYASPDATATLETTVDSTNDLPSLFAQFTANTPGRRITYKVLRPDFLVVAGTTPTGSFYTRMTSGTAGGANVIRGYTLTYPNTVKAQFDTASVAIADAFNPFPTAASPATQPPTAAAAPPPTPQLVSNGLAIGPDRILTILPSTCTAPQVAGRNAVIVRRDTTTAPWRCSKSRERSSRGGHSLLCAPTLRDLERRSSCFSRRRARIPTKPRSNSSPPLEKLRPRSRPAVQDASPRRSKDLRPVQPYSTAAERSSVWLQPCRRRLGRWPESCRARLIL